MKHSIVAYLFTVFIFFVSCYPFQYPPPAERKVFKSHCYDGQYTGIDTLINIDGYYKQSGILKISKGSEITRIDTFYTHFLFYNDGLFVGFFDRDDAPEVFLKNAKEKRNGKDKNFSEYCSWGRYMMHNDSIQIIVIGSPPGFANTWSTIEWWYKVIDRNTIIDLKTEYTHTYFLPGRPEEDTERRTEHVVLPAKFYPVEDIPPATGWIVNKKWFKCKSK